MKLASIRDIHEVEVEGVKYRLRTPSVYDSARLRRLARAAGARPVPRAELMAKLKDGLKAICAGDPDEEARWLGVLAEYDQLLAEAKAALPGDGSEPASGEALTQAAERLAPIAAQVAELEDVVERHCPPYAKAVADAGFWREMLDLAAVRLLVVAADGGASAELSDAQLAAIPRAHIPGLALHALGLFAPSESERKNSASPSPGRTPPTLSTLTATENGSPPTIQ